MSLILDALRKADAERERGAVPSLHSQPVVPLSVAPPKRVARPNWLWIVIGVGIGLAAAAIWVWAGRDVPPASASTGAVERAQPSTMGATHVAPAPATAVAPSTSAAIAPAAAPPGDASAVAEPAPWHKPEERKTSRTVAKDNAQTGPVSASPAEAPIYSPEQLPPDIRAGLPQLAIGGSIYSSNPAARSLIVNGQLLRERDRLTQELSLEEIRQKAAIFSYRGYRFEVMF